MYNKAKEDDYDMVFCNYNIIAESEKILSKPVQLNVPLNKPLNGKDFLKITLQKDFHPGIHSIIFKKVIDRQ